MHNLYKVEFINNKFALIDSGEYLMKLDDVQEIIEACENYLRQWNRNEIEEYNKALLSERRDKRKVGAEFKMALKVQKNERENKRFLYLIHNKRNGLYKIGLSINPIKRERTLQAEEPEIEILQIFKGGFELEKKIHTHFKEKRVRGEWFNLDTHDLLELKKEFIQ